MKWRWKIDELIVTGMAVQSSLNGKGFTGRPTSDVIQLLVRERVDSPAFLL